MHKIHTVIEHGISEQVSVVWELAKKESPEAFCSSRQVCGYVETWGQVVVVKRADEVIGFCSLEEVQEKTIELSKMYIVPEQRKQGMAEKMLECVMQETKGKNIILEVFPENTKAIYLYERFGFRVVSRPNGERMKMHISNT